MTCFDKTQKTSKQDVGKLEVDTEATHGGWGGEQFQIGNLWAESNSYAFVSN